MQYQNMGPFNPVNFKGSGKVQAIPIFLDKLPVMLGGLAGPDAYFGRVVSVETTAPRKFLVGLAGTRVVRGILVADPTIMAADPAMHDRYYEGRPATIAVYGAIELMKYDLSQDAPTLMSRVWFNDTTGEIAFTPSTTVSLPGYTNIDATVLDIDVPNGVSIWLNYPLVPSASISLPTVVDPVVVNTPEEASGAGTSASPYVVSSGTMVTASSATPGAVIYYTLDGSAPTMDSPIVPAEGIPVTGTVTIKLVAVRSGMNPSTIVSVYYTVA